MKLKINYYPLLAALVAIAATGGTAEAAAMCYAVENAQGQDSTDTRGVFATHRVPDEYVKKYWELGGPAYTVRVNGAYVGLFNDENYWGGNVTFGSFEFEDGKEVEIEVASKTDIRSYEVLPKTSLKFVAAPSQEGNVVRFRIDKADQKVTLVINGEYQKDVLHLFCNSIDKDAPRWSEPGFVRDEARKMYYFGPGYHRLADCLKGNSTLKVTDGWSAYLAAGAIVDGQIYIEHSKNSHVSGRGMLMNGERRVVAMISGSENSGMEGIIVHGHRAQCWNTIIGESRGCSFRNMALITTRYASTDGLDVNLSQDIVVDNVFIRSADDAVAIKALGNHDKKPAECGVNRNLSFSRMQLWNDCNNAFGIGAETRASVYENIKLVDSDVLYSYDDPNFHEKLEERSALNLCALQGTYFKNLLYDNIRVNRCQRLIAMGFRSDFWFGSIPGDQTTPGGIGNVVFRNITSPNATGSSISNDILLYGWHKEGTPDKYIENVTFENVSIMGHLLNNINSPYICTNNTAGLDLVKNVKFINH